MSLEGKTLNNICNTVHAIMQNASAGLRIPEAHKAQIVRKKISVFTYGLITELLKQDHSLDAGNVDLAYIQYLVIGGLQQKQAATVVNRTRDEFLNSAFGEECLQTASAVIIEWKSGNKDIKPYLEALL